MKGNKVKQLVMICALLMSIVVVGVAFTVAWYQEETATPYFFEIQADGILYVYVDTVVVENNDSLTPAVAIPGAIQEGLPYDVLKEYDANAAEPSYIEKTASVTNVVGAFRVYNEGYAYQPVELPKDSEGYTLVPVIEPDGDGNGKIQWIDDNDHSKGWQEQRMPIFDEELQVIGYSKETDYKPLLDANDDIVWNGVYNATDINWSYYGQKYWRCEEEVVEGSTAGEVNFNLRFKETSGLELDPDGNPINADDYYPNELFKIKRVYFSNSAEPLPEGAEPGVGNDAKVFSELSEDKMSGSFEIFGSEELYIHAEVYIAVPDELMDPALRNNTVYMAIGISVEVKQFEIQE